MIQPMDDIDRIMAVMHSAFAPEYGEAWTRGQLEGALMAGHCRYELIGADGLPPAEDAPAPGFALVRQLFEDSELLLFAVDRAHQGRGLGAALLRHTLAQARARGAERMMLEMRLGNPAERLYLAHGFKAVGMRPQYYRTPSGQRLDAVTMERRLD